MTETNSFMEANCVEFNRSWRDEWLEWVCAFANSEGGVHYIGAGALIAGALYRGGIVGTWGRGIENICRDGVKFGVRRPDYDATESDVSVMSLHFESPAKKSRRVIDSAMKGGVR